jgi:hypothetical protein
MLIWENLTEEVVNLACTVDRCEDAIDALFIVLVPPTPTLPSVQRVQEELKYWTPRRIRLWAASTPSERRQQLNVFLDAGFARDIEMWFFKTGGRPVDATIH